MSQNHLGRDENREPRSASDLFFNQFKYFEFLELSSTDVKQDSALKPHPVTQASIHVDLICSIFKSRNQLHHSGMLLRREDEEMVTSATKLTDHYHDLEG